MTAGNGLAAVVSSARRGDVRAVARLVSTLENLTEAPDGEAVHLESLLDSADGYVVGITGPPGVGKSTLTAALVRHFRRNGERVAVVAVDPSSPVTGGALLGDRIRMQEFADDQGVFIRSMAARGHLGGLAPATPRVVRLLQNVGFPVVLVETVGVGQQDVAVASVADTVVVVQEPGAGDAVQAAKAGILEIADIVVVNKADWPHAAETARDLREAVGPRGEGWRVPVVRTVASRGELDELLEALAAHRVWLGTSGRR
ncbi:MAG: methylmalonyl Co-A mutase-associated GTPase MeaB [Acidothermus sp.]|nr:methylmalonyl Co-A mutase-associated GTPase MeaB [Acidothermus sp.]MCL6537251.1 methylmalonyl Co-A mutase-associated GTPase MeaB [Acidothermus sp.]